MKKLSLLLIAMALSATGASGTDGGDNANNLYFNSLSIVPDPSSFALLAGPVLLGPWFFLRSRRQA